jgi:hypothetical protein
MLAIGIHSRMNKPSDQIIVSRMNSALTPVFYFFYTTFQITGEQTNICYQ